MNVANDVACTIPVEFVIYPQKQKILIDVLLKYSRLQVDELAELLDVTLDRVNAVYQGDLFFDKVECDRLVRYFCICCGG